MISSAPYIGQSIEMVKTHCEASSIPVSFLQVDTLQKAKELPCVFNNWAVFYNGKFETVNLLDDASLKRLLKQAQTPRPTVDGPAAL